MTNDTPPIRVMIVDDHEFVRKALNRFVSGCNDMVVVAEAVNGREAIDAYREHQPDVVLMDIIMPEIHGMEATRVIRRQFPQARIILLSSLDAVRHSGLAAEVGAVAYLEKGKLDNLADKIREVYSGIG